MYEKKKNKMRKIEEVVKEVKNYVIIGDDDVGGVLKNEILSDME